MTAPHLALNVTALLLAGLLLLGLSLQRGWRQDQARWPHHALFFAVTVSLALSLFLLWRRHLPVWPLLPALALLLSMPLTRPGQANHWQRALLVTLAFMLGVLITVR
ncbi:hypothetical protein [Deinococcus fonticola]|uniref:hypothetical protein n=1 Tax=Deinococcus fonticola TaxID=2528713 RepID=UPI0010757C87|nr:hypothetical protein [Deinococcus fonticola]